MPVGSGFTPRETEVARISLEPGSTPATATDHSLWVRARTTAGAGTIRMALYEGSTNITDTAPGYLETAALTTSLADYELPIADADAATITSYADLEVRFWGYAAGGGLIVFEVDQIWLATPAAAAENITAGYGTAGLVGSGASESLTQETGFATVGTVGYGSSVSVYTKTGFASVGKVGAGASVVPRRGRVSWAQLETPAAIVPIVKTGYGTSGLVGSGASASVVQETGYATVGTVGTGAGASVFQETGSGIAGTVGAGVSSSDE
jgi:hypothetical protein